ncbi:MAG: CHAD domain-containing protein [Chloroflexota bacterium]
MARAGAVPGIRPKKSLRFNAERVVAFRLEEMLSWRHALLDPARIVDLHDMRIAAKRLRYAMEMFADCFPGFKPLLPEVTRIQEDLGAVHDLDALIEDQLRTRLGAQYPPFEDRVTTIMSAELTTEERGTRLRRAISSEARAPRYVGLVSLIGTRRAERNRRFACFAQRWQGDALDTLAARIRNATQEPAPAISAPIHAELNQGLDIPEEKPAESTDPDR